MLKRLLQWLLFLLLSILFSNLFHISQTKMFFYLHFTYTLFYYLLMIVEYLIIKNSFTKIISSKLNKYKLHSHIFDIYLLITIISYFAAILLIPLIISKIFVTNYYLIYEIATLIIILFFSELNINSYIKNK